jgi:glycosyltransferase involved in cell wall biosynthesis
VRVSGFTFVRNGILLGYPFRESILSLLPLVDELIVNVPRSDDDTLAAVQAIGDPRVVVFESDWDDSLRTGGAILALQTNRALDRCRGDWAIYLQADEVLHEDDLPGIRAAMNRHAGDRRVDGLSFRFVHFEGGYTLVNPLRYRRQVRIVRPGGGIVSSGDACGFSRRDGGPLRAVNTTHRIFHYGWARPPAAMLAKNRELEKLYHDDAYIAARYSEADARAVHEIGVSRPFRGTHPQAMRVWIERETDPDPLPLPRTPYLLRLRVWRRLMKKWGLLR